MVQAFEVPALALPVSDGIADELEGRYSTKIRDRENGIEYRLEACVVAFLREHVHLEKALVRVFLDLDEIRNLDRRPNLRKVRPLS